MTNWKEYKIGEIADIIDSLHKTPTYSNTGYPMVRVTDIKGGFLTVENTFKVSKDVFDEMIRLAKEIKEADRKGEDLGLDYRELAFYSALEVSESSVAILGDEILKHIARELVDSIQKNTSIDWAVWENVQAKMRIAVKKILRKHGYPPDMEKTATETVLQQAKLLASEFSKNKEYRLDFGADYLLAAEPDN